MMLEILQIICAGYDLLAVPKWRARILKERQPPSALTHPQAFHEGIADGNFFANAAVVRFTRRIHTDRSGAASDALGIGVKSALDPGCGNQTWEPAEASLMIIDDL